MYEGVYTIWLPCGCYIDNDIDKFREWCWAATTEVLWLELNRNIDAYFFDELDFCIACDFNIIYGQGRTEIGEAEYQLKYNVHNLDYKSKTCYENIIIDKMLKSCKYIPMHDIYKNGKVEIECDVYNKDVLVVDDLYQSGATMW